MLEPDTPPDWRYRSGCIGRLEPVQLLARAKQPWPVLAVAPDSAVRIHITDVLRNVVTVRFATRVADLNDMPMTGKPVAALLYLDGSYDQMEPARWIEQLRQLRAAWVSLPIIGYAPLTTRAFEQGVMASRVGVDEIALRGGDMLREAVGRIVDATSRRGMSGEILRHVLAAASPLAGDALRLVRYCVENAGRGLTVGQLSAGIGLSRRTLAYRLRQANLPAPESLIMWGRLLVVAWLLQDPQCTINQAARALRFRELSALRSLAMSYLGYQPRALREPGAITKVAMAMAGGGGGTRRTDDPR